ncbi:MAG: DUF1566 domain-containing protein, partial [Chloroflexi bacterium]|nr:DUF1566 domain-containing protein [Chloroflexota bacterium]
MFKRIRFIVQIASLAALVVIASSVYAKSTRQMLKLPDTGQTTSYTETFGEDSDYNINPPTYTDNGDTVTDEVTGLIWQQNEVLTTTNNSAATAYCDALSLGSYSDWRLPTSHELYSLVDLSTSNPPLNTTIFTNNISADYWWSSTQRADGASNYWAVNSGGGIGPKPESEAQTHDFYVRCVRDNLASTAAPSFTDNGDETVTENNTSLMWQRDGTSSMAWEAALIQCESLTLAGHQDWRLPNIKELRSISDDDNLYHPSVSTTYFTLTETYPQTTTVYWSSTTRENGTEQAWFVDFYYGLVSHQDKVNIGYVLCMRSTSTSSTDIKIYLPLIIKSASTVALDFTLTSSAIVDGELLETYKCEEKVDGVEASIPLSWSSVPASAGSLAVTMHHYPNPEDTSHVNSYLLLWDIDPSVTGIAHGEADDGSWFMGANK